MMRTMLAVISDQLLLRPETSGDHWPGSNNEDHCHQSLRLCCWCRHIFRKLTQFSAQHLPPLQQFHTNSPAPVSSINWMGKWKNWLWWEEEAFICWRLQFSDSKTWKLLVSFFSEFELVFIDFDLKFILNSIFEFCWDLLFLCVSHLDTVSCDH